jgi:hypothetical protein
VRRGKAGVRRRRAARADGLGAANVIVRYDVFTLRQLLHVLDVSLDVQHPHALRSNQTLRQVGRRRR